MRLKCRCGEVEGTLKDTGDLFTVVCMCKWCQVYAKWTGHADELLDEAGGTAIYQVTPSNLSFEKGADKIRSIRITPKGGVRWHTACCKTPIANTLDKASVPWCGVPSLIVEGDPPVFPVRYRIHARQATGPVENAHPTGPYSLVVGTVVRMAINSLRGRARPSPFFDDNGRPVAEIQVLTSEERKALPW